METPLFLRHYYFVRLYFPPRKICIRVVVYKLLFLFGTSQKYSPLPRSPSLPFSLFPRETTLPKYVLIKIHFQDL